MRDFPLLIKPASADCNFRCDYCFYLSRAALYPNEKTHRMTDEVLSAMIRSYMATKQKTYSFAWQGGEPTLMGVDFYARAIQLQQKFGARGAEVSNALQTNGANISREMASLFARYRFLLGVSLDGPADIHDVFRRSAGGGPTHSDVMRSIGNLRESGTEFNILALVSSANAARAKDVYSYLVENGFYHHQYIPCVEFDERGGLRPFAISGEEWGDFLCGIFDEWLPGDTRRVSVRLFDAIIECLISGNPNICVFRDDCRNYVVIEYNGDVYPCDFFVNADLKLGNIMESPLSKIMKSDVYAEFGARKSKWNAACADCRWKSVCAGDCLKHRHSGSGYDSSALGHLCAGWKKFFDHSMNDFKRLADEVVKERREEARRMIAAGAARPERNAPCPCGSGKKYKRCCAIDAKT